MFKNMAPPVSKEEFHQNRKADKVKTLIKEKGIAILIGGAGVGKTEIALQVIEDEKRSNPQLAHASISCQSVDMLRSGLENFLIKEFADLPDKSEIDQLSRKSEIDQLSRVNLDGFFEGCARLMKNKAKERRILVLFDDLNQMSKPEGILFTPAQLLGHFTRHFSQWNIIVTTQTKVDDGEVYTNKSLKECCIDVDGFSDAESEEFFKKGQKTCSLTSADRELIKEKLEGKPVFLVALCKEIECDQSPDPLSVIVKRCLDKLNQPNCKSPGLVLLWRALSSAIGYDCDDKDGNSGNDAKVCFLLLMSMFDGKNYSWEFLISIAEVACCVSFGKFKLRDTRAADLVNEVINAMVNRCLCAKPDFRNGKLFAFHSLVKSSIGLFKKSQTTDFIRNALLAITRIMPRDGRHHLAADKMHLLLIHANALLDSIEDDDATSDNPELNGLLIATLHMSMAYCKQSGFDSQAKDHITKALDQFTRVFTEKTKYGDLQQGYPTHMDKALVLYDQSRATRSLHENESYKRFLEELPYYYRLTTKDLNNISPEVTEDMRVNDHISGKKSNLLTKIVLDNKLTEEEVAQIFPAEVLVDIYATAATIHAQGNQGESAEYVQVSLELCEKIEQDSGIMLMQNVIMKREKLKAHSNQVSESEAAWAELKKMTGKAYERGLMRSVLEEDEYHQFLCQEGIVRAKAARVLTMHPIPNDEYQKINSLFKELIVQAKSLNYYTQAIAYKYYGGFLLDCGQAREAVRAIIDSLYYLNQFLEQKAEQTPFRELEINCGKARPLWDLLETAFKKYDAGPSGGNLLEQDGTDDPRLKYIRESKSRLRLQFGPEDSRFLVLEKILESRGIVEEHWEPFGPATPDPKQDDTTLAEGHKDTCSGATLSYIYADLKIVIKEEKVAYFSIHQDSKDPKRIVINGENVKAIHEKLNAVLDSYRPCDFSITTENMTINVQEFPVLDNWVTIYRIPPYLLADEGCKARSVVELLLTGCDDTKITSELFAATTAHSFISDEERKPILACLGPAELSKTLGEHGFTKKPRLVVNGDPDVKPINKLYFVCRYFFRSDQPENSSWLGDLAVFAVEKRWLNEDSKPHLADDECSVEESCAAAFPFQSVCCIRSIESQEDLNKLVDKRIICKGKCGTVVKTPEIEGGAWKFGLHLAFTLDEGQMEYGDCGSLVYLQGDGGEESDILGMFFGTLKRDPGIQQAVIVSQALKQITEKTEFPCKNLHPIG